MKKIKFVALAASFIALAATPSCAKESNLTRVCMLKTVDSMNLYLTANAKGNISNTYIYLNDAHEDDPASFEAYAQEVYDKGSKVRPNCDIAYFPLSSENERKAIKKFLELDTKKVFKVVYIDCYDKGLSKAAGIWMGREGWIKNSGTSKKFISGLSKSAQYRIEHEAFQMTKYDGKSFNNFEEMYTFIQTEYDANRLPEFIFNDKNEEIVNYKNTYEYVSVFAAQNRAFGQPFNDKNVLNRFKKWDDTKFSYINNETAKNFYGSVKELSDPDPEISTEGQAIIGKIKSDAGDKMTDDRFNLKEMQYGIYHATDASKPASKMTAIILISVLSAVAVGVIGLLIFRRIKTGKKLFDIKKALDSDIDPDDPRVIRMKKVAAELKEIRIKNSISIEDAAYLMRMPVKFLEEGIEAGEMMVSKKLRSRFIACYNLPKDYFDKAYKIEEKK